MKQIKVQHQGKMYSALAEKVQGKLWIYFNGKTHVIESPKKTKKGTHHNQPKSDQVVAPMPGKITKLLVQPGQKVEKNQPVIVMEAMKMEYTLKSEISSEVQDIKVKLADQVTLGALLVQLKPAAEDFKESK